MSRRPFLLAQLSDPHIGADWCDADPVAGLARVVEAVLATAPRPDSILVSGDLAEHAAGGPGQDGEALQYSVEHGPMRLIVVDTARRGENARELDAERLAWLDAELAAAPERPALLAMHPRPFATGVPAWDEAGLPTSHRRAAIGRDGVELSDDPPAFALHAVADGEPIAHVQPVR